MAACGQPGRPPLEAATPHPCLPQIPLTAASLPSLQRRAPGGGLARRPLPARSGVTGRRFGNGGLPTWTCSPEVSLSLSPLPLPPSFRPFLALGPVLINPDPSLLSAFPNPSLELTVPCPCPWPRTSVHRPVLLRSRAVCSLPAPSASLDRSPQRLLVPPTPRSRAGP